MKSAITDGQGGLWLDDLPTPALGPYDCLVDIEACAFCNSTDAHLIHGAMPFDVPYPAALGHETVGTVIQVGSAVKHFTEGDRILRAYAVYPDEQVGGIGSAWGGFAEYGRITDWAAMGCPRAPLQYQQTIPAHLSPEQAALLIPQKEAWSALDKVRPLRDRRFLITGAGITALLFGYFLKCRGAAHVTTVARRRAPLDRVLAYEAADDVCLFEHLDDLPPNFDAMIETTGSVEAASDAVTRIRPDGAIYAYAVYPVGTNTAALETYKQARRFTRIDPDEAAAQQPIHDMAGNGQLNHEGLITHQFTLDRIADAWEAVQSKQGMKILVRP